jgi:predicted glycosyltransferase
MKILIEAHHPGDIHFWKYPIRELLERGHEVKMIARERDVMRRLVEAYDWIDSEIPPRTSQNNKFPLLEMLSRQWAITKQVIVFKPDVVASLFGSYCQTARILGRKNVIFTDSEFQHFNHRIAHPFAHEVHTPYCFYKNLGSKQIYYRGIHEMSFLSPERFQPDASIISDESGLRERDFILIRLSAWNTLHDINHSGMGREVERFIERFEGMYQIVICAEENTMPAHLRKYAMQFSPEKFHDVLWYARFVLTEGASTASESACLGVPTVYINSTEPRGYLQMLEKDYGLVRSFEEAKSGVDTAIEWLDRIDDAELERLRAKRKDLFAAHDDVVDYVVTALERFAKE